MNQKNELTMSQKAWWALGQSTGRQFITALVATYILVFLTDTFGVPAGAAGVIMTCAAIWDAVNDPIIGNIADRTKSRWGTYRPYLLFIPRPGQLCRYCFCRSGNDNKWQNCLCSSALYLLWHAADSSGDSL